MSEDLKKTVWINIFDQEWGHKSKELADEAYERLLKNNEDHFKEKGYRLGKLKITYTKEDLIK